MDLTIIIVNWNTKDMLRKCLSSIEKTKGRLQTEIIVVDNASSDGSRDVVRKDFPDIFLINSGANLGFAMGNNLAIPYATAPIILFLNPDTIVGENTLQCMYDFLIANPSIGALGCKAVDAEGKVQELGIQNFPTAFTEFLKLLFLSEKNIKFAKHFFPYHDSLQSGYVKKLYGVCLMTRKAVLDKVGSFDKRFFMYCEDVDLSYRIILNGWRLYYLANTEIIHFSGGASRKATNQFANLMICQSMSLFILKYYHNWGRIKYRTGVFIASIIRLFSLVLFKMFYSIVRKPSGFSINSSIAKYLSLIKWSLNLMMPIVKR